MKRRRLKPRHEGGELCQAHGTRRERNEHLALTTCVRARLVSGALPREGDPAVVDGLGALDDELPLAALLALHAHRLAGRHHEAETRGPGRGILGSHPFRETRSHLVKRRGRKNACNG